MTMLQFKEEIPFVFPHDSSCPNYDFDPIKWQIECLLYWKCNVNECALKNDIIDLYLDISWEKLDILFYNVESVFNKDTASIKLKIGWKFYYFDLSYTITHWCIEKHNFILENNVSERLDNFLANKRWKNYISIENLLFKICWDPLYNRNLTL